MKHTHEILDNAIAGAHNWSGAYRAGHISTEVDIEIIAAIYEAGYSDTEAEWIFRSKHLRWFYDEHGDMMSEAKASAEFTKYIKDNGNGLKRDIDALRAEEARNKLAPALSDTERLDKIEALFSSGNTYAWNEFMTLVAEKGFRKAADIKSHE
jgi:hypothetical protein